MGIEAVRWINGSASTNGFPIEHSSSPWKRGPLARARDTDGSDRVGGRSSDYHHKVETAFRLIAIEEPERVVLVDASGSQDEVTKRLFDAITELLAVIVGQDRAVEQFASGWANSQAAPCLAAR